MLSKKMQEKAKIYLDCLKSGEVCTGSIFEGVRFAKAPHNGEIHIENQPIYVHGLLAEDELLVSAGNQRYFFSLKDGWGIENHHLAAVSCGFFMDFGRPVTKEEIRALAAAPCDKQGTYSAIAEQGRKKQMQKMLVVLN